jgi:hypothetical protein
MSEYPHEDVAALNAFYGDPRGANGRPNPHWEADNIVLWTPPYPMFYTDGAHTPLHHLRVHKKVRDVFDAAYLEVLKTLGLDYIAKHRLNLSAGAYDYRIERGGSRLSVHSWGCAIDMDPAHNLFPHRWNPAIGLDQKFVAILKKHGFHWRGDNGDIDPMHLQLCVH